MADFAFPNAIFPVNVNNAPFPGRVPVARSMCNNVQQRNRF